MVYSLADGSEVHALDNVSLEVAEGEIVTVLGPSGCGKTTLLNILAGFLAPSAGHVRVGSHPVRGPGPERGMVFQQGALFPPRDLARPRRRRADSAEDRALRRRERR